MIVLGISSGFHDSAAALVVDGVIVAAVEEERLTRIKHDPSFPTMAMDACCAIANLSPAEIDVAVCHEKPLEVVNRHLAGRVRAGPRGFGSFLRTTPRVIATQLGLGSRVELWFNQRGATCPTLHFVEHHISHAAAAFFASPFESAAVLTVDGVGEWSTSTIGFGHGRRLRTDIELRYPDSVGLLYSAFTSYCGFAVNSGEGELMGLAPYGEPRFVERILSEVVDLDDDGSIRLDQDYFSYLDGRRMISPSFEQLFGGPPRPLGAEPTRREADLAASIQQVLERIVVAMAQHAKTETGSDRLCLSGGVALNCVANAVVRREGIFAEVWAQPAPGDAGSAIGAALWTEHETLETPRPTPAKGSGGPMNGAFLGPRFGSAGIRRWLDGNSIAYRHLPDRSELCDVVADRLAGGAMVGWFTGRMEFGPRALGHRSILADARSPTARSRVNGAVKERAMFRPFAPAVLADRAHEFFELSGEAEFMNFTARVLSHREPASGAAAPGISLGDLGNLVRSDIPAVTHVDGSARVQTVEAGRNTEFEQLLRAFDDLTGCPVLLNTSFNGRNEPIVCTPDDALATFRRTGLDLLVLEDCLVEAGS